ncbi:MAG: hypothetical protein A3E87_00395 [Gammaproteobacteria bacterium RIFCSPHIGHO2_12_FULL_35_23]|nr:MAG: hypothetical protein A3E87_00395 [Gammaproteobacteria bacterium RIFCSPHIGHO2_12_FULL_35_23]
MTLNLELLRIHKLESLDNLSFKNLLQYYQFECSSLTCTQTDELGLYNIKNISSLSCNQSAADIYILYYERLPIGFIIVNPASISLDNNLANNMADIFIMPFYRRKRVGEWFIFKIFDQYSGTWEVRMLSNFFSFINFIKKIISKYAKNNYEFFVRKDQKLNKDYIVYKFYSNKLRIVNETCP